MADTKTNKTEREKQGQQGLARQQETRGFRRWEPGFGPSGGPFEFMDRMTEEMDHWFNRMSRELGMPRRSRLARALFGGPSREGLWIPRIEAVQQGDTFIVRADLPGIKKDDVEVDLTDDAVTIRGERHEEHEEEREGYWHSEREYGQFHRTIPLPEGVISESAKATFRDGVLEIRMQAAPSEANRGRKVEITEGPAEQKK